MVANDVISVGLFASKLITYVKVIAHQRLVKFVVKMYL